MRNTNELLPVYLYTLFYQEHLFIIKAGKYSKQLLRHEIHLSKFLISTVHLAISDMNNVIY